MPKGHPGWGGKRAGSGRPRGSKNKNPKLTPRQRADVARNYIALRDYANSVRLKPPYRKLFIGELAANHGISERMVKSCLDAAGLRRRHPRIRDKNEEFRKSKAFKRNVKKLQQMKQRK